MPIALRPPQPAPRLPFRVQRMPPAPSPSLPAEGGAGDHEKILSCSAGGFFQGLTAPLGASAPERAEDARTGDERAAKCRPSLASIAPRQKNNRPVICGAVPEQSRNEAVGQKWQGAVSYWTAAPGPLSNCGSYANKHSEERPRAMQ